ncbi:hypothetical protein [Asticcacaulis sp. AC402]|uniref:hypothetical protein n=1 Tax=Asticcacaulis sp. AC402 TaxID=1282361 RepID=UPI0003C412AF|nr:hypothetical protein [Asticcacaulis sp. AC402]ESQ74263.1 hypothetical protein ABAC402_14955 [Asticcacaulis sp. AC402]
MRSLTSWCSTLAAVLTLQASFALSAVAGPLEPKVLDSDDLAWFYNRPGAGTEQVAADQNACLSFGRSMFGTNPVNEGMTYGLTGAIIGEIAAAGPNIAYADDCMMARGYRRFDITGSNLRQFRERYARLAPEVQAHYAGAEVPPEGTLRRKWANTYWLSAPGDAPAPAEPLSFVPRSPDIPTFNRWGPTKSVKPVPAGTVPQPGPDEAVVLMTVSSPTGAGAHILFDRREASGDAGIVQTTRGRNWPGFEARTKEAKGNAAMQFAFVIPAGIYSLANVRTGRYDFTTFCLGTVAFDVAAGDVVDLGHFTMVPVDAAVDPLAPAPKVQLRIDQPSADSERNVALATGGLADRLRPAVYFTRFPRMCTLFSRIYGFDMPGAAVWSGAPG